MLRAFSRNLKRVNMARQVVVPYNTNFRLFSERKREDDKFDEFLNKRMTDQEKQDAARALLERAAEKEAERKARDQARKDSAQKTKVDFDDFLEGKAPKSEEQNL